jgi:hypothetical protein
VLVNELIVVEALLNFPVSLSDSGQFGEAKVCMMWLVPASGRWRCCYSSVLQL